MYLKYMRFVRRPFEVTLLNASTYRRCYLTRGQQAAHASAVKSPDQLSLTTRSLLQKRVAGTFKQMKGSVC